MKDVLKNLTALVKVKTIVTLVVIAVFGALALKGNISPDNVMIIVSTVPILIAYGIVQKFFKGGVMVGSVKG